MQEQNKKLAASSPSLLHRVRARYSEAGNVARAAALVSAGSMTLVIMATVVKHLGSNLPAMEILFFRSAVGFLFVLPVFWRDPFEPLRTKRLGMHFTRGTIGAIGNICFFWTITHMLLADAMALQFSRPLFMIPLAIVLLHEHVSGQRIGVAVIGFFGIMLYARPFTGGFDGAALIGALGAIAGGLVVIGIKRLATTEPTRVIMFYYAFWSAAYAAVPTVFQWVTPDWWQLALLVLVGFLGIAGQGMITHGLTQGDATVLVPLDYSRIVYSAILGYLLFSEVPGPLSFAGMGLIVACSLYLVLTEKKPAPSR